MGNDQQLKNMVARLRKAQGARLVSVVLYGPRARGETVPDLGHLNLLIVTGDLEPSTLEALGPAVRWWLSKGQPWPRIFTQSLIRDSLDVYPVEFLDISHHHQILHGADPLAGIEVDTRHLRHQCERELREKMMRLREGYVECSGASRALHQLLVASHTSLAPLWHACLHLLGDQAPARDDVTRCLCEQLQLEGDALQDVASLATGERTRDPAALFSRYLGQLDAIVARIDRLTIHSQGDSP